MRIIQYILPTLFLLISTVVLAQVKSPAATEVWEPEPRVVTPGAERSAPSDAIVLYDGSSTEHWQHHDSTAIGWVIDQDGVRVEVIVEYSFRIAMKFKC